MAYTNEILVGRINRGLQKLFGVKGPAPVPQLASEVMAIVPLFHGAENRYLDGWHRFGMAMNFPGLAANVNLFQLRNPSTSNVVAVIEKLDHTTNPSSNWQINFGARSADLTTLVGTLSRLDPRANPNPAIVPSQQQAAGVISFGGLLAFYNTAAQTLINYILTDGQEIPLLPGDSLLLQTSTVNVASQANFIWRERFLEESERA